jgi:hypothetical protein
MQSSSGTGSAERHRWYATVRGRMLASLILAFGLSTAFAQNSCNGKPDQTNMSENDQLIETDNKCVTDPASGRGHVHHHSRTKFNCNYIEMRTRDKRNGEVFGASGTRYTFNSDLVDVFRVPADSGPTKIIRRYDEQGISHDPSRVYPSWWLGTRSDVVITPNGTEHERTDERCRCKKGDPSTPDSCKPATTPTSTSSPLTSIR